MPTARRMGPNRPSAVWRRGEDTWNTFCNDHTVLNWDLCLHVANPPWKWLTHCCSYHLGDRKEPWLICEAEQLVACPSCWGHRKHKHIIKIPIPFHWESKASECQIGLFFTFLRCIFTSMCLCVELCTWVQVTAEAHEGSQTPRAGVTGAEDHWVWVLGTELRSSGWALHALNFGAISPDQHLLLKRFISSIITSKSTKFHKIC